MATQSKKQKALAASVDLAKAYPLEEAVKLVKANARAKFDETIEVSLNLGVDPRHADQQVRSTVLLPNGLGKTVRVVVFAEGDDRRAAEAAGRVHVALRVDQRVPQPRAEDEQVEGEHAVPHQVVFHFRKTICPDILARS